MNPQQLHQMQHHQNQSAQGIRQPLKKKPPQILGQTLSKLSPQNMSTSPQNQSRSGGGIGTEIGLQKSQQIVNQGMIQQQHYSKFNDIPGKRPTGQAASSSPKQSVGTTNKLFLKGFHQEHKKLFHQGETGTIGQANSGLNSNPSSGVTGNIGGLQSQSQFHEYKKIPVSTKNGTSNTKIIFTSPSQSSTKHAHLSHTNSKKGSPDGSANAYLKTSNDQNSNTEQQANLMNFLQRRASEEKLNMKLNKSNNQSNGNSKNRQTNNPSNIMYQEYLYQKSRSPQNMNGPGKVDYYKMINNSGNTTNSQQNFGLKGTAQVNYNQQHQLNHSNNSNGGSSQQNITAASTSQYSQKSRNNPAQGLQKYKTSNQVYQSQSPEQHHSNAVVKKTGSPLQVKPQSKQGNMFYDKRQSYQPLNNKAQFSNQKTQNEMVSPTQTRMGVLDDDENDEDDDEDSKREEWKHESHDENIRDDADDLHESSRASNASQKKNLRDVARKLWLAVEVGDKLATLKILQSQAGPATQLSINCTNTDGWAPMHVAASEGHTGLVEILIEYGAVIDARTKNFRTPLHIACIRGHFAVIQTLLMAGSDPDAKDIDGNTPAHFCAEYGHQDCLRFLLTRHPTLFAKNSEGKSPIDVAVSHEILQTFEEYIKSVKHFLYNKNPVTGTQQNPTLMNKNRQHDQSHNSSDSSNSAKQTRQLQVDEVTLKQRATNKQIQILDSLSQPEKKRTTTFSTQQKGGTTVTGTGTFEIQTELTTSTQQPQTSSMSSNTGSQTTDDDSKVGPQMFLPIKMLGSGSFGEVYLVKEKRTGNLYAMKVLSKQRIMGQNLVRYAKTERDVLSYTKHPFIVNLNYAFQTKTKLFLILDFCPGGDLGKILQRERKFTEDRARIYISEILLALEDLHKRDIIYRDLKPDNVVLDEDGHALLTDFGLSKEGVEEGAKGAKSFCGSVAYLAPEMLRRVGHGKSVDWYLLGVLLYEMVVGCPPYFSPKKEELFHNIQKGVLKIPASLSEECKNLIVSLLNRNPSKRLGAGIEGSEDIKKHPFFNTIEWQVVREKKMNPPKPDINMKYYAHVQNFVESNVEDNLKKVFDDFEELDPDIYENRTVQGWSFVQNVNFPAGNLQQQ